MGRTADATASQREKMPYEMGRLVKPDVLERTGPEGKTIFGVDAQLPYLERGQWDRGAGGPETGVHQAHPRMGPARAMCS